MDSNRLFMDFLQQSMPERSAMPPPTPYVVKNNTPLNLRSFSLKFKSRHRELGVPHEMRIGLSDYAPRCTADILAVERTGEDGPWHTWHQEEDDDSRKVIGHIRAQVVQTMRVLNEGESLFEVCDNESQELADMHSLLYDEDDEVKFEFSEIALNDILYIHDVFLEPQYRGYGIGLLALEGFITGLPSFSQGLTILSPHALSSECPVKEGEPGRIEYFRQASRKLTGHWKKMGFVALGKPEGYIGPIMGRWEGYMQPLISDIVPHLMQH